MVRNSTIKCPNYEAYLEPPNEFCDHCQGRSVCTGMCPELSTYLYEMKLRGRYSKFEPEDVHFTKAEKRILLLLTKGRERQEICHVLHISMNTLLSTLGTIRKKGRILVKNLP